MELEGFKRSMLFLDENELKVDTMITDMHGGIQKHIRITNNSKMKKKKIKHFYDTWHVAKSKNMFMFYKNVFVFHLVR